MAEPSFVSRFREAVDYVNVQMSSGSARDPKWIECIFGMIKSASPMTIQTGSKLMAMISSTTFPCADRAEIASRINDKVDFLLAQDVCEAPAAPARAAAAPAEQAAPAAAAPAAATPPGAPRAPARPADVAALVPAGVPRRQFQENLWWQKYLTADLYKIFQDPTVPWPDVLQAIGERMAQIGLLWPSEPTCLHIWTVFMCARVPAGNGQLEDGMLAIERRQQIAQEAQHQRTRFIEATGGAVIQYPNNIQAFAQQYPQSYEVAFPKGAEQEFTCPLDDRFIARVKQYLPCRFSHSSMNPPLHRRVAAGRQALAVRAPVPAAHVRGAASAMRSSYHLYGAGNRADDYFNQGYHAPRHFDDGLLPGLVINPDVVARGRQQAAGPFGFHPEASHAPQTVTTGDGGAAFDNALRLVVCQFSAFLMLPVLVFASHSKGRRRLVAKRDHTKVFSRRHEGVRV